MGYRHSTNDTGDTIMDKAQRIAAGEYTYKGWQISRMDAGHWNCGPLGEHFTDSFDTLRECKLMIDRYLAEG
jgi:hypothetical protein